MGNWRRKKSFWNEVFHLVSSIPYNEMVVLAGDMNGNDCSSVVVILATMGHVVVLGMEIEMQMDPRF